MKKNRVILSALICAVLFGFSQAKAQTKGPESRDVTVNILLKDIISAGEGIATGEGEVNFVYETAEDYREKKEKTIADQIRVLSTKDYVINVKAQTTDFIGESSTLPLNILKISASKGTESAFGESITPTTTDQVIVSNGAATLDQAYDFKYEIAPSQVLIDAAKEKYSVVLTYTVTAQ